ncbi:MAG: hypothetical protein GXP25_10310 [Planctomycetes bacterium]|nr:hypothetical protein [Planctomycetota bacterium]
MEPVQEFVKLCLEQQGYFVRSDVRYVVPTPAGKTSSYADLDLLAVRIDRRTNRIKEKIWGEVKAHFSLSLSRSYVKRFVSNYATMLNLSHPGLGLMRSDRNKLQRRQDAALETAAKELGKGYRRVLYFAGRRPTPVSLREAKEFFLTNVDIEFVEDLTPIFLKSIDAMGDNEPISRIINMLRVFGALTEKT